METWQIILAIIIVGLSIVMPVYYSHKKKKLERELKEGREVTEKEKIRDYLGPKVLEELPSLEKGGFPNIFEINQVPSIIICIDVLLDNNPKFEEIIDQIKNKFIRDREDSLVKEYIENLRNFYEIEKYSF